MCLFFTVILTLTGAAGLVNAKPAFMGNFVLSDVVVDSPFQTHPESTNNSSISFTFADQDLPDAVPIHCNIEWAVDISPPSKPSPSFCDDPNVSAWLPEGSFNGVGNLSIELSHSYIDNSVGAYPYNVLTKFGGVNLTYPSTPDYECDAEEAHCESCEGATLVAIITRAIA